MKLYLNPEQNPEYDSIIEGFNHHAKRWHELNREVHALRVPSIYSFKVKKALRSIGKRIVELQQEWLALNAKAVDFHANPHYVYPDDTVDALTFQHYQEVLIHRINHYESTMTLLASNYNLTDGQLKHTLNFNIAIVSIVLSLAISLAK